MSDDTKERFEALEKKLGELTERTLLVERVFESYKQQPLDTVPKEFRDLSPFTAEAVILPHEVQCVEVGPWNAMYGVPRYCRIHAQAPDQPNEARHLRLGSVGIMGVPQMQIADTSCRNFVSTRFYDLQYGAPVKWGRISAHPNQRALLYLMNPHETPVHVHIEVWCDTRPVGEYYPPYI